jgi:hypothetical protein
MKKLILNRATFAGAEVLSRAQLKKVMGGSGEVTSASKDCPLCSRGSDCPEGDKCPSCNSQTDTGTDKGACGK